MYFSEMYSIMFSPVVEDNHLELDWWFHRQIFSTLEPHHNDSFSKRARWIYWVSMVAVNRSDLQNVY